MFRRGAGRQRGPRPPPPPLLWLPPPLEPPKEPPELWLPPKELPELWLPPIVPPELRLPLEGAGAERLGADDVRGGSETGAGGRGALVDGAGELGRGAVTGPPDALPDEVVVGNGFM